MRRIPPESFVFTLLLAALGTLPPFSIDMALPALSQIAAAMSSSVGTVTLTLSFFMAGFSLAQLVFGPVSDRFGRRPTLLVGCFLFTVASFACAIAPNIELLLLARFIEGCGAGAGMVMVFAMVRDSFEGMKGRTKLSYVTLVLNVAPMIAPMIGAWVLHFGNWQMIYATLGVGGALLTLWVFFGLGESLKNSDSAALQTSQLLHNYGRIFRHREASSYMLINALSFGCMFAYVSGSSFVMMQLYGLSADQYGLAFGSTALSILFGSFVSGKLSERHVSEHVPLALGLLLSLVSSAALCGLVLNGTPSFPVFLSLCIVSTFGYGIIAPNAAHGAMHPMPEIAGVAGASLGFLQMAGGTVASALFAQLCDDKTAWSMTGTMVLCAALSLSIYVFRIALRKHSASTEVTIRPADSTQTPYCSGPMKS